MAPHRGGAPASRVAELSAVPTTRTRSRVLVLGAGFIGAHVTRALLDAGHRVDILTRSDPRPELAPLLRGASIVLGDVTAMAPMASLVAEVDHVVYAVGSSSPVESDLDPARDASLVVPPFVRLLETLRLRPSVGLTYLSSGGAVYGNVQADLVSEDARLEPISSYGILKQTAEQYLRMYVDLYGVSGRVLRVANVYGPGQPWAKGHGIVARLIRCAVAGEPFPVFGDGGNIRDYVYVADVADVVTKLVTTDTEHTVLNLGSGVGHSIIDVIREVEAVSGLRVHIEYRDARPFDVRSIVLDQSRLRSALRYHPTTLSDGIAATWRAFMTGQGGDVHQVGRVRVPGLAMPRLAHGG